VDSFRQLLAHNGSANQIRTFNGAGDVAQRVEFSVGWSDLSRLPNHGAAAGVQHATELRNREIYIEPWDRFELVECATGVAEAASAYHRDDQSCRRNKRREHERGLVADAARGMFVDLLCGEFREVQHLAGAKHGIGESRGLRPRE